jgi:hypothetical protein
MLRLASVLAAACALLAGPAHATMYRCGNNFQDHPCEGGTVVVVPGSGTAPPAAAPKHAPANAAKASAPAAKGQARPAAAAENNCDALRSQHRMMESVLARGGDGVTLARNQQWQRELEALMAKSNCS